MPLSAVRLIDVTIYAGKVAYNSGKVNHLHIGSGIHAEVAAIKKYIKYNKAKSRTALDVLVIRTDKHSNLLESRPCYMCMKYMIYMTRYINIRYIYHSTKEGVIVRKKLIDMWLNNDTYYTRKQRSKMC